MRLRKPISADQQRAGALSAPSCEGRLEVTFGCRLSQHGYSGGWSKPPACDHSHEGVGSRVARVYEHRDVAALGINSCSISSCFAASAPPIVLIRSRCLLDG